MREAGQPPRGERSILVGVVSLFGGSVRVQIRALFLRCVLEKIPVEAAVPAELELLAALGSGSKLPSLKGCLRFAADGPFLPVDFVHSPSPVSAGSVLVASRQEPVFAAPLFASTAPSFPGRAAATPAPPEPYQAPFLSLAGPWHYAATLAVGPLLPTDHLLG